MRRTKIVCTLGPSSNTPETVAALVNAGMDVARLNFSHGRHDDHRRAFDLVRDAARSCGRNIAIMADLQGPKIRTGRLRDGKSVLLADGDTVCVTTRPVAGDKACLSTTYAALPHDVVSGDRLLLADGALEFRVVRVEPPDVECLVVRGGLLGENKGINLPGVAVSAPALTEKDAEDLAFALELGVDYVALSFVRRPEDVRDVRERIRAAGRDTPIVAKIERPEALECLEAILDLADAVMVARGDLGVVVDLDDVPQIQKHIIQRCNARGVPVITATQMLESMMTSPRPTRAEAADVANAVYDGTDAVMLSGETAAGRFPLEAVRIMDSIVRKADRAMNDIPRPDIHGAWHDVPGEQPSYAHAIGHAVSHLVETLPASRIVCFTMSGYTARMIARHRPRLPVMAVSLSESTIRRCALCWGVEAFLCAEVQNTDAMVREVNRILTERELARQGDTVVIVAGTPLAIGGRTNLLKVHAVGDAV